jgi:alpha-beta hydrolase superfamily lysophospholipase
MTTDHTDRFPLDPEVEECYRYEIRGAMDAVVRYCRDVVNEHSHRGFWTPTGDHPDHAALIDQARRTILSKLRMVLDCAEAVATEIENDRQRHVERQARE